jgi:hypothetical protein
MLREIARKDVSGAQWTTMLKVRERFSRVLGNNNDLEPTSLIMTWSVAADKPDGHFAIALGTRSGNKSIRVLWIGVSTNVAIGGKQWAKWVREACKLRSSSITAIQLHVGIDMVRVLHRIGFRLAKSTRSGISWSEPPSLITLMKRLPTPRTSKDLPALTHIDSLFFLDELARLKLTRSSNVEDDVPMYLKVT